MLRIALASLRTRWPSLAGAFVALALGAGLLIGCAEVIAAAADASHPGPVRYASAPIVVAGPPAVPIAVGVGEDREVETDRNPRRAPVDPGLASRVAALPGVVRTAADRSFAVRMPTRGSDVAVGRPWSARLAAPYRLVAGRAPLAADEVVAVRGTGGLRLGAARRLVTPAGPAAYRVVGVAAPRPGATAYEQPLFFADARAAELAPAIDALAVWPRGAAASVRALLARERSGAVTLTGSRRAEAELNPAEDAGAASGLLLSMMALTVAFVTMLAVASAFAFAVALRRRELGLLRAVGATPRQVRRLVLHEAALVACAAAAAGGAASLAIGPAIAWWLTQRGLMPGPPLEPAPSLVGAALGAAAMVVVAVAGAWAAARRAARVRPTEALRDAAVDRGAMTLGRWVVGLPSLAIAGLAISKGVSSDPLGQMMVGLGESICLILGLTMLAPLLVPRLVALVVLPGRALRQPAGLLARRCARAGVRQASATAGPVLVIVGLAGALSTLFGTLAASDSAVAHARVAPASTVVAAGARGLAASDLAALRAIPGARVGAALEADIRVMAPDGVTPVGTLGLDREAVRQALRLRVLQGSLSRLEGHTAAIGALAARALHLRVGDRLGGWLPDGARVEGLEVVAVLADGLGATSLYVPSSLLASHVGGLVATTAYVQTTGDPAAATALRRVADARGLAFQNPQARVVADPTDSSNMNPLALAMVVGIATLYVAVMLVNTAAVATAARSGERALLRLAGATPRQLLGIVAAEALATTTAGGLLGLAVTGVVAAGLGRSLHAVAGPTALAVDWGLLVLLLVGCGAITVLASVLVTARTQRSPAHRVAGVGGP